ncbi:hypothetical protein AKJ45_00790 [candidate division MSBL1 archaeon SCGC-AAA261F19]|uniref:Pyrroloquinoline quinone biosynthesis protein PqqD n=1 Tax=candidate division MSBL1 archaeon SCGC-AAA261F19 TaxID=1698275 RepID=A0A133VB74_9EURY|nr:hypothetical protein AKJ45_00790 [candidate division MSBL1 archaeon SCGC-AAA261F19]
MRELEFREKVKIWREEFGAVIFDILEEKVFATNQTGADILDLMDEGKTEQEIVSALKDKYSKGSQRIAQDVSNFIIRLQDNGFLRSGDSG